MIGEIFEWILFGFFCILGVITTICESKGIFDPAAIKSTPYFYILLDWKTITALAVISGIYVLWKYIGAYGVLIAAGYLLCVLLIKKKRYNDQAGQENKNFCPKSLRIFKRSVKIL